MPKSTRPVPPITPKQAMLPEVPPAASASGHKASDWKARPCEGRPPLFFFFRRRSGGATCASRPRARSSRSAARFNIRVAGKQACWIPAPASSSRSARGAPLAFASLVKRKVIPNGAYERYVERVVDSSRYWVLKIAGGPESD